jgi:hypothetical protein
MKHAIALSKLSIEERSGDIKRCPEIGKAKRKFSEMCKPWSAFNRSKACCISMYVHTRKASYQRRVTEENLCSCCEELLMI